MKTSEIISLMIATSGILIALSKEVREWKKEIREGKAQKEKRLKSKAGKQKK